MMARLRFRACRWPTWPRCSEGPDHLVLAAPDTPETHHVIGPATISQLKRGVHLVNIARGGLIDQDALRAALDDGRVARATLDVCDPEPLPAGHWLYTHPKVRLTGHLSWSSPRGSSRWSARSWTTSAASCGASLWRVWSIAPSATDRAAGEGQP